MFQLQISDLDATSGSIPVSWCLDEETIKLLADRGCADPQVVICVTPCNIEGDLNRYHCSKEYRKVAPLKDLLTYIEFRSSGPCKIWGFISSKRKSDVTSDYLDRYKGQYQSNIINFDGDAYSYNLLEGETPQAISSKEYRFLSKPIDVDVPEGVFASEPADWEKDWVNHFFNNKVVDQCDFRRRRLFAYGVQPFIMSLNMFVRLFWLMVGCLFLLRGTSLKYILHPLTYDMRDCIDTMVGGSILYRPIEEYSDVVPTPLDLIRMFGLLFLSPVILIPILFFIYIGNIETAIAFGSIFLGLGVMALIVSALINYRGAAGNLFRSFLSWLSHPVLRKDKDEELWYLNQEEIKLITCSKDTKPLTYNTIPAKHKTIKLRFQNLKSKVCKPFSL